MTNILLVEDEVNISGFVSRELKHEGYNVDICADGREGLESAMSKKYHLIVLDLMLPSLNGIEILRRIRAQDIVTPVIILTARDQVMDKVTGLDLGADDYMTKPFAIEEFLARIRVLLKRNTEKYAQKELIVGDVRVDFNEHEVSYKGTPIKLTKREYDLLVYLMNNKNIVMSREKILDSVWGFEYYGETNVVDVYIRYLRSKIDDPFGIEFISTVHRVGYIVRDK